MTNPADAVASPYGWLDTNGEPGQEYTYTRGNNVWAFDDSKSDDTPAVNESADGGAGLNFDFPFDPNEEPLINVKAAITNLFYMNNKMHDIFYRYGFDEQAANFQSNNYGHPGLGGDEVYAQAVDGSGTDNANFSTPSDWYLEDGSYLWVKSIVIGYNFPRFIKNTTLRVYLSGDNLITITTYSGMDPEVGGIGFDGGQFPISRVYAAGVKLTF